MQCPPDDVDELFTAYSDTLSSLVDKHAPLRRQRVSTRSRACGMMQNAVLRSV